MSILKNKKVAFTAIAVFAIVGLIWFAVAHWPAKDNLGPTWPTISKAHTFLLRPATSKESSRLVDYAPDHTTIKGMRIEYRDGKTALVSYTNGKPTTISTYFPLPQDPSGKPASPPIGTFKNLDDGLAARKLFNVVVLKDDGKTIKAISTFKDDGSYAAIGVRDSNDDFAVTIYGSGSTGVASLAVFNGSDGSLKSEQDFRDDGSIESSFTTQNTGGPQAKQTFFDEAGNRVKEIDFNGDDDTSISEFASDGKTVIRKTRFGYSGVTVTTYDATGTNPVLERNYADDTHINVRYFDAKGNATMKQTWVKLDTTAVPADQVGVTSDGYYLGEVYEYHSDGTSTKVDVTFYPGGKFVQQVISKPTTEWRPSTTENFRPDGSLDNTETCPVEGDNWTPCTTTKMPDGPNKVRAKVPADYYKVTPLLPAPAVQKPTIPALPLTVDLH